MNTLKTGRCVPEDEPNDFATHVEVAAACSGNNKVEVSNIPVNKWIHIVLSISHKIMGVFINGNLVKQLQLDDYPRQNDGSIYLNPRGGYSGYLSRVYYHAYALNAAQILTELAHGPARVPCVDTGEMPPY